MSHYVTVKKGSLSIQVSVADNIFDITTNPEGGLQKKVNLDGHFLFFCKLIPQPLFLCTLVDVFIGELQR